MSEEITPEEQSAQQERAEFFDRQEGKFFRRADWTAFWTTLFISFGVYFYTLAPTVTLEDAGEMAVASDYLGVPHPPGYPIWTLLTWFFQWIFDFVEFHHHPNPAWSVGLASAVFGALTCGLLAMLISRSGTDMLRGLDKITSAIGLKSETMICWSAGVTGGLLLAFSPVLWSQSVIVEVYSLNGLFMVAIMLLTYMWICRPKDILLLYIVAFLFGLGLTNHQTLLFMGIALAAAVWFRDRPLFRDTFALIVVLIAGYLFWQASKMTGDPDMMKKQNLFNLLGVVFLLSPIGLFFIERKLMTQWKRVTILAGLALLGISFYAYMPFASEQNPPMNWGYPRTPTGFKHAITRGQYERINPVDNFKEAIAKPSKFFALQKDIIFSPNGYTSVVAQFTGWISLLVIVPFLFLKKLKTRSQIWMYITLIAFLSLTVLFIIFQWPKRDVQTLFIGRVQYIQAHAVFALWIAYGLIFLLAFIDSLLRSKAAVKVGVLVVLLLPLVPLARNAYDSEFVNYVGGCEQNGHDFGWQFGYWQLRGANGIREQLDENEPPLPNPEYPPEMGTNAVFYGGTDPGRFVPTYMIYSAKSRSDVYLITQNALADNTYMNVMRDLYGESIYIPSQQDSNYAFQKYVEDVQSGRIPAGAEVTMKDGRVSVQGVQGVMMINGILAKMIFEANKHKHDFFVEESYVIPWMYPYLEPHGLIMKINPEPIELNDTIVKNDTEFWDWYATRLDNNPKFHRDVVARKTFSKLRSAIAGIYAYRKMFPEAEVAFRQAIKLYPLSPEANFRLADVLMQQGKFAAAREVISTLLEGDPGNDRVAGFLEQIKGTERTDARRSQLEQMFANGSSDINSALELANIYRSMGRMDQFQGLTMQILNQAHLPADIALQVGQLYANAQRFDLLEVALKKYLEKEPGNPRVWLDLSALLTARGATNEAFQALRKAVELGGEPVRDMARQDQRFNSVRNMPQFQKLVPPVQSRGGFSLPMQGL